MRAIALVCTLNASPAPSSSHHLAEQVMAAFSRHDVPGEIVRIADHDVRPGIGVDLGDGDAWPVIREKVLAADILLIATPSGSATRPASASGSWNG